MDYIGRNETIKDKIRTLKEWPGFPNSEEKVFLDGVAKDIERMLAERIQHGEWIETDEMFKCSVCGCNAFYYPFCPYCGARMRIHKEME